MSKIASVIQRAPGQLAEMLRFRPSTGIVESRDDIEIIRAVPHFSDGVLDHYHLRVNELDERGRLLKLHRVVRLMTLASIPQEQRGQATMIGRAVSFLQGVYTSRVDLLRLSLGLFDEPYFGIVQVWGVRADGQTYEQARSRSAQALAVLQAGLPGVYEKTRWRSPSSRLFEAIRKLFTASRYALVQVGHPAPREAARGPADLDRNTAMLEQALQQVEQVYRGMAALQENFVHLVMAVRIDESEIMRLAFANAHELSTVESRINGSTGWHVSFGVPIILSKAVSSSAGVGHGTAENRGRSVAEGQTHGQAHTDGQAHSVVDGEAHTVGRAESWGETSGVSEVHSRAVSVGESHVASRGVAESHGESHGVSRVESHGVADSVGVSESHGLATGVSRVDSHGVADGVSHVESRSVADGVSSGVSDGVTSGWNRGESHGVSHGVSEVDTHGVSHTEGVSHGESVSLPAGSRTVGETHGATFADPANPPTTESWSTPATTVTTGETHPNTSPEALAAITGEPMPTGDGATPVVVSPGGEEAEIGQLVDFVKDYNPNPFGGTAPPTAMGGGFGVHDTPAVGGATPLSPEVLQNAAGTVTLPGGTRSVGGNLGIPGGPGVSASESGPINPTVSVQLPGGQVSESVTTPVDPSHGISVASGGQLTEGHSVGVSTPLGPTVGESHGANVSDGLSHGHSVGEAHGVSDGVSASVSGGESRGVSSGLSHVESAGVADGISHVESQGVATGVSRSESHSVGLSRGHTVSRGLAVGESHGVSHGVTHSEGQADGVSRGESFGVARGSFRSVSHGVTESEAHTVSRAEGHTVSQADTVSHSQSRVEASGVGEAVSRQQALARASSTGVSAGLVPSIGFSRSWQTKDMTAEEYAKVLRVQQQFYDVAQILGAFWTDTYIYAATLRGRAALESLVASAFRGFGDGVVTPLTIRSLTEDEQRYILAHGLAFSPSRRVAPLHLSPELYWDATLLTAPQLAALVTPGLFEEGLANTTREAIPKFRFEPSLPGDIVLGHQISYEREQVVYEAPMVIDMANTHNIGVFGDTGMGKSHLVMWLIYELVTKHNQAAMILDMSTTDRGLVHILPGQVEVYSLYPGGPNPVPWNPMQVGGRVGPTAHKNAVIESLKTVGGLGDRQTGLLNDALRELYLEHGVLTDDNTQLYPETDERVAEKPDSPRSETLKMWAAIVDEGEEAIVNRVRAERGDQTVPVGTPLATLEIPERQALARLRSRAVNLGMLFRLVKTLAGARGVKDRDKEAFSGIAQRLTHFNEGPLGAMYSRRMDSVSLNDLLAPGKVVVLETGVTPELPEVAKGMLLNMAFMILYMERAYILAQEGELVAQAVPTWVVLEEANKVLAPDANAERAGKVSTSSQVETIARDCRKFGFRLVVTGQNPSLIPMPILTNCNTIFAGKLKGADDRKALVAAFAKSESGFTDEDYKRFQSSMPKYWFVGLLALEQKNWKADPVLFQGLEMPTYAPSDAELRVKCK